MEMWKKNFKIQKFQKFKISKFQNSKFQISKIFHVSETDAIIETIAHPCWEELLILTGLGFRSFFRIR